MLKKIKEKFRKIPTPFRQILLVLFVIILIPIGILFTIEFILQTSHFFYKIDSYLTKKSYSRDVSVTFVYKGEEYKINSNVKCVNKGMRFAWEGMTWFTMWKVDAENDRVKLKDAIKVELKFLNPGEHYWNVNSAERIFRVTNKAILHSLCEVVLKEDQEKINFFRNEAKQNLIKHGFKHRRGFEHLSEKEILKLISSDKEYANADFDSLIEIRYADMAFDFDKKTKKPLHPDVKITSLSFEEIKPLPTKFFNSFSREMFLMK